MKLGYNKDALGKELPYCGITLGVSFAQFESYNAKNEFFLAYGCFHGPTGNIVYMRELTGYEVPNCSVEVEPKFKFGQLVYNLSDLLENSAYARPRVIMSTLIRADKDGAAYTSYLIDNSIVFEDCLLSVQQFKIAKELNDNK
jgi:hypothetical protein